MSVFNGPAPVIRQLGTQEEEVQSVADWIVEQRKVGVAPHEFGLFVRSADHLDRATGAAKGAGVPYVILDETGDGRVGYISISTMHLAKGREFRAVAVMACDDEVIPLQERIETVDDAELQKVYDTERQLLYVACTRARDHLLVTKKTRKMPNTASSRDTIHTSTFEAAGIEPNRQNKQRMRVQGVAHSGAAASANGQQSRGSDSLGMSPDDESLRRVINAWPRLPAHIKASIELLCQHPD